MKGKTWFLVGFLIILILVLQVSCENDEETPVTTDGDTTRSFQMEYDHMWSYDALSGAGEDRARNAFSPAKTSLNIYWSNWIDDQVWNYRDLDEYVKTYAQRTNGLFDHQCYLLALGEVTNLLPSNMGGATRDDGIQGKARSFIFVHNIRQYYPTYEEMVHKVVIHELGHARANLSHLCIDDTTMSDEHDLNDCVMAQGRYATCTGYDVTAYLRFCNKCINRIHAVKW